MSSDREAAAGEIPVRVDTQMATCPREFPGRQLVSRQATANAIESDASRSGGMADAGDLKSPSRKGVLVRAQPPAPNAFNELQRFVERQ